MLTYGVQPNGNAGGSPTPYNQPNGQQSPYNQSGQQLPYGTSGQAGSGAQTIDGNLAYSYENAQRVSIARAYAEMTVGLLVTAAVAVVTQMTDAFLRFLQVTGGLGWILLVVAQLTLVVVLSARVMHMQPSTARVLFYVYAASMGFTLSSIFYQYDLGSIGITLALCAGFYFALTMLALTTKRDMLKAGPILLTGLIVLIFGQLILFIFFPSDTTIMVVSAIGVVLFAFMTVYDAQRTRAIFAQYSSSPEMIKRVSILCALSLYLDFVNMFLYLLRLFGSSNN